MEVIRGLRNSKSARVDSQDALRGNGSENRNERKTHRTPARDNQPMESFPPVSVRPALVSKNIIFLLCLFSEKVGQLPCAPSCTSAGPRCTPWYPESPASRVRVVSTAPLSQSTNPPSFSLIFSQYGRIPVKEKEGGLVLCDTLH